VSDEEIPTIVVRAGRDGYRATIPALGNEVIFGPSVNIGDVVAAARQTVFNHLRSVLPGPGYPFGTVVVASGTRLRADDLLALIEGHGVSQKLNLSGCYLPLIDLSRAALEAELAKRRRDEETDEPPWRSLLNEGMCLGDAILHDTYLGNANLEGADLTKSDLSDANLTGANLDNALLWHSDFGGAFVRDTRFRGADFLGAHLRGVDLYDAHLEGALWRGALLDRTRMRRERLGKATGEELEARGQRIATTLTPPSTFHDAREAYLGLKTNFDSIGRYDDASWAYVKEQQMEKAMYFPTTTGHEWVRKRMGGAVPPPWWGPSHLPRWLRWKLRSAFYHCRLFLSLCPRDVEQEMARRTQDGRERNEWLSRWRWARNWAYELLTGYGERVHMPVIWAGVVVLVFALIYAAAGNIASGDVGALQSHPTHSPITALTHSISAFATVGFNTLEPVGWGARLLTAIEAMFGIGLFALFVFTLGNRMRRS